MDEPSPHLKLANRIYLTLVAATTATKNWRPYLYEHAMDRQPELRNRIFQLLVCALLDAVEEYAARHNGMMVDCKKVGHRTGPVYLGYMSSHMDVLVDHLSVLPKADLVLIAHSRDQLLHGQWSEIDKDRRSIRYIENGRLVRTKVTREEHRELIFAGGDPTDARFYEMRDRLLNARTYFWTIDRGMGDRNLLDKVYLDLLHNPDGPPKVGLKFPDKPHPAQGEDVPDGYRSFFEATRNLPDPPLTDDPVPRRH